MEIDFNPSQIPKPELARPTVRTGTAPAAISSAGEESVSSTTTLAGKLTDIPLVRPEKVAQAKALVGTTSYPPVELLVRIANLLGVHLK